MTEKDRAGARRRRGAAPHQRPLISKSVPPSIWGLGGKILGAKRPKFGAEGAILENFSDFLEKLFLENAIKSKNSVNSGFEKVFVFFRKIVS